MVSSASSRRVAWLLFAVAWGTNHFVPLLIVYRTHLALSSVELAVLFGVYAVGLVPGLLLGGPLSDRAGRRAVVLPAAGVELIGTCILAGGAAGFGVLLAGRFVVGLGAGATFSAGTAWVQDLASGVNIETGAGARRAAVALSSGFGGGPLVTGMIAQWLPWPMQLPYGVHAAVLVACLACLAGVGLRPAGRREGGGDAPSSQTLATHRTGARDARNASMWSLPTGFAEVAMAAPWVFVLPSTAHAVLPSLVRARLGPFPVVFAGVVTGITLLAGVLVQPFLRRWPPRRAGTFGLSVGALGLGCGAIAANALSPAMVLAAAVLLGTAYGGCLISGLRFVESRSVPGTRGRLTGVYYSIAYIGFASPLAIAAVGRRVGDVASLVVVFFACVATLAWTLWNAPAARPRRGSLP